MSDKPLYRFRQYTINGSIPIYCFESYSKVMQKYYVIHSSISFKDLVQWAYDHYNLIGLDIQLTSKSFSDSE